MAAGMRKREAIGETRRVHGTHARCGLSSGPGRQGLAVESLGANEQSRPGALLSPPIPLNHISAEGTVSCPLAVNTKS